MTPDPRVRLVTKNGSFSLQIKDAVPQDAGDYICQIATLDPMEIIHTVEILGKKIWFLMQFISPEPIVILFAYNICQLLKLT